MRIIITILCAALPSCGLFTPDTTPIVDASAAMLSAVEAQGSIIERLVNDPENTMVPDVRQQYLAATHTNVTRARTLHSALVGFAADAGQVDWSEAYAEAQRIYGEIKGVR